LGVSVTKPTQDELERLDIKGWSPWECEPSTFDWEYDSEEWCYFFAGKVKVDTPQGQVQIEKGDFVKFPKGLKCTWNVLEKVRKAYLFK